MTVFLVSGGDASVLRDHARDLVTRLVGDADANLVVDEYDGDEYELAVVADSAQTLPFLTDMRVVVARGVERFNTEELTPLLTYLEQPLDSTHLVLVHGAGRVPKKLADGVDRAGGQRINTSPPNRAKERVTWIASQATERGVLLDTNASARIADQIGDDPGRLGGILEVLLATYGADRRLSVADVESFIGDAGDVPPWDLTDALDAGRVNDAIAVLHRMMHGGERHPLQIMAILTNHYMRLARLDGADARDDQSAAEAMGIKPGFPAKKALKNFGRLGAAKVHRAVDLLAAADRDIRGASGLPADTVMEILVARLARL